MKKKKNRIKNKDKNFQLFIYAIYKHNFICQVLYISEESPIFLNYLNYLIPKVLLLFNSKDGSGRVAKFLQ